ncbi:3-methyl-2-oxobutanoate hydroxymethyltransferase [Komagataeibacter swingsii]|uniref:3-methyl-2-oxobutanoate hydroxymethyltransferase n=1 Tax=Komagataeibacter swingsii TaxID=215220 RepID=A0A850P0V5_9PROT|nr:3-methyl-2-oxobutanoate hydroxymethyltransferase [Komagataeibacter swingsii]AHI24159.1 3-methyl-2-oxobutanoate hydroxymethyltransferase [Komagataeibacter xylinus E25]NVN37174.1 3-methyl-2-oxobutanoate hydroxymethyltransferase [Komagataeibacter swingsii]RFP02788.1 3-methyl-2-oxobutanoate hydroxymethyltransferase [Komagataeibacter xylinus]RFP02866.1 3-methyl-2-oxobutanoate hydroxymethyltransferase [Komagataeibacter xylinus]
MGNGEQPRRRTIRDVRKGDVPGVWLTAYTAPMARRLDPHVDVMLVGDSLGMVVYGMPDTLGVSMGMMIAHGAAVVRASRQALVVVDMPFGSYQQSPAQAFGNAARIMAETGCGAVKLEGGTEMADTVRFLSRRGIPVCGHVGLMPQAVNTAGGFRTQGRDAQQARRVREDARAIADAGAFAIVLEGTVEPVARQITTDVPVPVIGIGASPACDGQVLVVDDMLGAFGAFTPRFVRRYADMGGVIDEAVARYAHDVRTRGFPAPEECFGVRGTSLPG